MMSCLKYNFEITCAWKKEFAFLCYHQRVSFRLIFGMDLLNCLSCYHSSSLCVHCVLVKFVQSDMSGNPDSSTLKSTVNGSHDSFKKKKKTSFHSTFAFQTTALHLWFQLIAFLSPTVSGIYHKVDLPSASHLSILLVCVCMRAHEYYALTTHMSFSVSSWPHTHQGENKQQTTQTTKSTQASGEGRLTAGLPFHLRSSRSNSPLIPNSTEDLLQPPCPNPAPLSSWSHRFPPPKSPPTLCFISIPNSSKHFLGTHRLLLSGKQVGWLQPLPSPSIPPSLTPHLISSSLEDLLLSFFCHSLFAGD